MLFSRSDFRWPLCSQAFTNKAEYSLSYVQLTVLSMTAARGTQE